MMPKIESHQKSNTQSKIFLQNALVPSFCPRFEKKKKKEENGKSVYERLWIDSWSNAPLRHPIWDPKCIDSMKFVDDGTPSIERCVSIPFAIFLFAFPSIILVLFEHFSTFVAFSAICHIS
ncbi:hypothetical protein CEXT_136721 [Caerostris extrusa]|uniref:Transmembrane protein n=1 Tax=Caerostris extrusa TaxID=172846 RepID=A0AAV4T4U8_CAEEX|nr:hypothetical protein CEXT_136721 [Caerostris extrusa]